MDKKELKSWAFLLRDSMANFIFAAHESCPAEELFRPFETIIFMSGIFRGKRTGNHLRITIGTQKEMEVLIEFLRNYLNEQKY